MNLAPTIFWLILARTASAETSSTALPIEDGTMDNRGTLALTKEFHPYVKDTQRSSTVLRGDNVIAHVADGGTWSTSVTLTNLESRTVRANVLFFRDDGSDLPLPVVGQGTVRGLRITLGPAASLTFNTAGVAGAVSSGWMYILKERVDDGIGGFCVLRQRSSSRGDFETMFPLVSQFDTRGVLLYDNTSGLSTAAAFVNPSEFEAVVTFTVRSDDGSVLERKTFALGAYAHAFRTLSSMFPTMSGRSGSIEFAVNSGDGVGVIGLRFNPSGAFSSFSALSNVNWAN